MLVAGNGVGKYTFYRLYLQPLGMPFVNADVLAKVAYPDAPEAHSYDAAKLAEEQHYNFLLRSVSFCFETVYSHPSKVDFVGRAKALGYQVIMMIHLESPALNQARISERVSEGGHDVPADKVVSRIPPGCYITSESRCRSATLSGSTTTVQLTLLSFPSSRRRTAGWTFMWILYLNGRRVYSRGSDLQSAAIVNLLAGLPLEVDAVHVGGLVG